MSCLSKSNTIDIQDKKENWCVTNCCKSRWTIKKEATALFNGLGLDMSTAVKLFFWSKVFWLEAGSNFEVEVEYEGDLEVYFVKFIFSKKGGGVFSGNSENELDIYCNYELSATVILE